jgi:transcriptional regulator with XRE-family HTH domain
MPKQVRRGVPLPHLREWRFFRMWTQQELAARSGVSNAAISYIEAGTRDPLFGTINKLAAALGIDPNTLRYEAPPQEQPPRSSDENG